MSAATQAGNTVAEPKVSFTNIRQVFDLPKQAKNDTGAASSVVALDNVNLEIPDGQFVALVGASGCGKTTLMNMIAGLVKPTAGTVEVSGKPPRLPNLDIGYKFARDALLPWRSARRSVELPLEVRGWDRQRRRERADEMLDLVGLRDKHTQYRNQLSQGMRQRVALARTLASDPSILLMANPSPPWMRVPSSPWKVSSSASGKAVATPARPSSSSLTTSTRRSCSPTGW